MQECHPQQLSQGATLMKYPKNRVREKVKKSEYESIEEGTKK